MTPNEAKIGDTFRVTFTKGLSGDFGSRLNGPNYQKEPDVFTVTKRTNFRKKGNYRLYLKHAHGWGCAVVISSEDEKWPETWETVTKTPRASLSLGGTQSIKQGENR